MESSKVVLAKYVYVEREKKVITTFSLVVKEDFSWDVVLPDHSSIPKTSYLFQQHISVLTVLTGLLVFFVSWMHQSVLEMVTTNSMP